MVDPAGEQSLVRQAPLSDLVLLYKWPASTIQGFSLTGVTGVSYHGAVAYLPGRAPLGRERRAEFRPRRFTATVAHGALEPTAALRTPWANVLSSALGGPTSAPSVTDISNDWSHVHLLSSDGLTRHVPDKRIRERLLAMTSARQVCEELLQDALDGGGRDNITIVVGRALAAEPPANG
jgi:hypothetical protein